MTGYGGREGADPPTDAEVIRKLERQLADAVRERDAVDAENARRVEIWTKQLQNYAHDRDLAHARVAVLREEFAKLLDAECGSPGTCMMDAHKAAYQALDLTDTDSAAEKLLRLEKAVGRFMGAVVVLSTRDQWLHSDAWKELCEADAAYREDKQG